MLKNHIKIAWRNIFRQRIYSAINILGLTLSIISCLVIYLIASYELTFDTFHPHRERIFRITKELQTNEQTWYVNSGPPAAVDALSNDLPGIEIITTVQPFESSISLSEESRPEEKFSSRIPGGYLTTAFADSNYFKIFKYEWLVGKPSIALSNPFNVVLSEKSARKYFGKDIPLEQIIGKDIQYDSLTVLVSGIVSDWEGNTDFPFTDFISLSTINKSFFKQDIDLESWGGTSFSQVFFKISPNVKLDLFHQQFEKIIGKKTKDLWPPEFKQVWKMQALEEVHFTDDQNKVYDQDFVRKAYKPVTYGLIGLAVFLLLLGVINFVNLSTAQSIKRSKEIGIRKVLGGLRSGIIFQFLIETFFLTVIAVCFALLLVEPVLKAFDSYVPEGVIFDLSELNVQCFVAGITVVTTFLAGIYPAIFLSSYVPAKTLKGDNTGSRIGKLNLRNGLITFQFAISSLFIMAVIVMQSQYSFIKNKDLGFTSRNVLFTGAFDGCEWKDGICQKVPGLNEKIRVLVEKLKQIPGVNDVSVQGDPPGFGGFIVPIEFQGETNIETIVSIKTGDANLLGVYEMKLLAGKNLEPSDSVNGFIINEEYAKALGFRRPIDAIGQLLYPKFVEGQSPVISYPNPIIGVVSDFHIGSLHDPIKPIIITHWPQLESGIGIQLSERKNPEEAQRILSEIQEQWKLIFPDNSFYYKFVDQWIDGLYEKEHQTIFLVNAATVVTIFIACIGIFGLSSFNTEIRAKETGIRKVLGASTVEIIMVFCKEFVILTFIASLIVAPVGWYLMSHWLSTFAYKITISWWMLLLAGFFTATISIITIGYHTIKTVSVNPAKVLKNE